MTVSDLLRATASPPWVEEAACRGVTPDLFYPGRGESAAPAKAVCAVCIVRDACLQQALDDVEKQGVWGGTSEKERRVMRHNLRKGVRR